MPSLCKLEESKELAPSLKIVITNFFFNLINMSIQFIHNLAATMRILESLYAKLKKVCYRLQLPFKGISTIWKFDRIYNNVPNNTTLNNTEPWQWPTYLLSHTVKATNTFQQVCLFFSFFFFLKTYHQGMKLSPSWKKKYFSQESGAVVSIWQIQTHMVGMWDDI